MKDRGSPVSENRFVSHLIQSFSRIQIMNTTVDQGPIRHEEITARARELWQKSGSPEGRDLEFWLAAEAELQRERDDVKQTARGDAKTPPRSTPSGGEPAPDTSQVKAARKTRRVSAPLK